MEWNLGNEVEHFKVGDKVKTRGDMGDFNLTITAIHNDHYCTCKGYCKSRHFNMNVLQHRITENTNKVLIKTSCTTLAKEL